MALKRLFLSTVRSMSVAGVVLCLAPAQAGDGVYKWVDKDGKVHYSDMPPPQVNATKLRSNTAAATAAAPGAPEARPATNNYVDQEVEFRKRRAAADESAKKQAEKEQQAEERRQHCADSRGRLAMLQQGGRVYRTNEKGERVFFDDKKFAEEIAKEKKFQDQNCKA